VKSWEKNSKALFNSWSFGPLNYKLFGAGLFTIFLGYFLMATGETESFRSIRLAPIILIIGYCGIIPAAILVKQKEK
tara:strand:+ start:2733 stop:2963 length:231 start_codon:yes stop_codon:yes gene_type:complete